MSSFQGSRSDSTRDADAAFAGDFTFDSIVLSVKGAARHVKFMYYFAPLLTEYYGASMRITSAGASLLEETGNEDDADAERHRLWDLKHEEMAPHIANLYRQMGGMHCKAAQYFATQGILLPKPMVDAFHTTFEDMPERAWEEIEKEIMDSLKNVQKVTSHKGTWAYFRSLQRKPLAAASIGQTHRAKLWTDVDVVVKVLYADSQETLKQDLQDARQAAMLADSLLELGLKGTINRIMDEMDENFPNETNFKNELAYMDRAAGIFLQRGINIKMAEPYRPFCGERVLTSSFMTGTTFSKFQGRVLPLEQRRAAHAALLQVIDGVGQMMLHTGFFHADTHPGNVMLMDDGSPGLIDFGQCAELTTEQRLFLCRLILLMNTRSVALVGEAVSKGGFTFNTNNRDMQVALMYMFFDSSHKLPEAIPKDLVQLLRHYIAHDVTKLPILTDIPKEVVFFGRVIGSFRKCLETIEVDESVISLWSKHARQALLEQRGATSPWTTGPMPRNSSACLTPDLDLSLESPDVQTELLLALPATAEGCAILERMLR
ncbi:hypothetical protein CYMTET_52043, partial [Cymbomonas tetramitiformis]